MRLRFSFLQEDILVVGEDRAKVLVPGRGGVLEGKFTGCF